jgi:CoA:oxalate CoA-transferase
MAEILEGIRILDFSRFGAGPLCPLLLADMGADVIRVEKPGGEDDRDLPPFTPNGWGLVFMACSRHKKCITLNLNTPKGVGIMNKLVSLSDVVVHNFPLGSKENAILSYEKLKEINKNIIVTVVSAFGQSGPYAEMNGFDVVGQAMSGAMSFTGFPGQPPTRAGVGWVDWGTGIYAALGTVLALYHRLLTGQGQLVDVSLMDTAVSFVGGIGAAADFVLNGVIRTGLGNQSWYSTCNSYKAKDGWVVLGVAANVLWKRLTEVIGQPELGVDPRFANNMLRFKNRELVDQILNDWIGRRTVKEVVKAFQDAYVPASPVYDIHNMVEDPHVKARKMLIDISYPGGGKALLPGLPIKFSKTPGQSTGPVSAPGEHNREIYGQLLGLDKELEELAEKGVI